MATRLMTGVLLAIFVVIALVYLPAPWIYGAVTLLAGLGSFECARMLLPSEDHEAPKLAAVLSMGCVATLLFVENGSQGLLLALAASVILTLLFFLRREPHFNRVVMPAAVVIFSVVYAGLLFSFLALVRAIPLGAWWLLLLLAATFSADTGAYFAGRYFGKHKLAPKISPAKTWEGFLGGVTLSIFSTFFCKYLFFNDISILDCIIIGAMAGLLGPLGDLSESLLKRSVGIKDSGNLIPGHGGLLDRVDALLFVAPVVYGYIVFIR